MESDRAFLARFESAALPAEDWTHEAQLRATFLLLRRNGFHEAIRRLRSAIPPSGCAGARRAGGPCGRHETLILAWARLVEQALVHAGPVADFADFAGRHPELRAWERVLEHYSPERLGSERAHREFVLPDRAPLPTAPGTPVRNSSRRSKDSDAASPDPASRITHPISRRN